MYIFCKGDPITPGVKLKEYLSNLVASGDELRKSLASSAVSGSDSERLSLDRSKLCHSVSTTLTWQSYPGKILVLVNI